MSIGLVVAMDCPWDALPVEEVAIPAVYNVQRDGSDEAQHGEANKEELDLLVAAIVLADLANDDREQRQATVLDGGHDAVSSTHLMLLVGRHKRVWLVCAKQQQQQVTPLYLQA